jgi:hypothetical protein
VFWDSSAIVPTIIHAPESSVLVALLRADAGPSLWWGSPVECQSALYRHHRDGRLSQTPLADGLHRLAGLVEQADLVAPTGRLRDRAGTLVATHPLRAVMRFSWLRHLRGVTTRRAVERPS